MTGDQGSEGSPGNTGAPGPQGQQGERGATGATGQPVRRLLIFENKMILTPHRDPKDQLVPVDHQDLMVSKVLPENLVTRV